MLFLLSSAACTATECRVAAPDYGGPVATITSDGGVNPFRYFGGAAHAHIRSIDDVQAKRYLVQPGTHAFELRLRNRQVAFDGEVVLCVVPGEHVMTAQRSRDGFDVHLLPVAGGPPTAAVHVRGECDGAPLFVPLVPLPLPH